MKSAYTQAGPLDGYVNSQRTGEARGVKLVLGRFIAGRSTPDHAEMEDK